MLEKPNIPDEKIISALQQNFSIPVIGIEFLPFGWDSWSFRVHAENNSYFLKIRKAIPNPAGFFLPRFLRDQGIEQVMAPLLSGSDNAWEQVDDFYFILYPFIVSEQVMDVGMSDAHWVEFGSILKQLHTTKLPSELLSEIEYERFVPPRLEQIKETHAQVRVCQYDDPFQEELAAFWLQNYSTISITLQRTEALAKLMERTQVEIVPCHGDVHTSNLLITPDNKIFIVDWEDARLAPKELDLMFLPGDVGPKEEELFFKGYGELDINPLVRAYYRHHWCVEDMGGFAEHIFTGKTIGEKTKKDAIWWFKNLFAQGHSIETALNIKIEIETRNFS